MKKTKRVEAVLDSKYTVENLNAPLTGYAVILAYVEESHGFMSRDTQYMTSFLIGKRRKDFQVDKEVYNRLREGQRGILEYAGSIFIDFSKGQVKL